MSFLPDLLTKLKKFPPLVQRALGKIPEGKQRLVLVCAGGGLVFLALVFIGLSALTGRKTESGPRTGSPAPLVRPALIPPEELFLPGEPDFVPGVLLEREQRTVWTTEDALPYWQDPLKNGEEQWRERIEMAADEFLERVP